MIYDTVLVDVFNLCYRTKPGKKSVGDAVNAAIDRTEETMDHLKKEGVLYLLYDPVGSDDLGISKVFRYGTGRKFEDPTYKAGRKKDDGVRDIVNEYKKYWLFRGPGVVSCYDEELEADDYVEPIVRKRKGTVAMVTTDEDWCRYLNDSVHMINGFWDKPFTTADFVAKYGFVPTIASVTLNKVFFGDDSDAVVGVFKNRRVPASFKNMINDAIKYVGDSGMYLDDALSYFGRSFTMSTLDYACENPLDELSVRLSSIDGTGNIMDAFDHNVRMFASRCIDEEPYAHWNPVDDKTNGLIEEALRRSTSKKPFRFGRVSVR